VQKCKCGTRAKFCEMLGVWGKVFRKIRFAYFLIFWRDFGGAGNWKKYSKKIKIVIEKIKARLGLLFLTFF